MSVDVKAVRGRRDLRFNSFDDLIADAENLVFSPQTRTLGNWPLGQLLSHLAVTIDLSIDGIPPAGVPWSTRLLGLILKGRVLRDGPRPGVKLPSDRETAMYPAASPRDALEALRRAVARSKVEVMSARHPVFGKLSHEEWVQLHLRHAALHLSFAVPTGASTHRFGSSRA